MRYYYKHALYIMLGMLLVCIGYMFTNETPWLSLILYLLGIFVCVSTFFEGISDSVKDGIERAKEEAKKSE